MSIKIVSLSLLAAGVIALMPLTVSAETIHLHAKLSGADEVPPHEVPGMGMVKATYNTNSKSLAYQVTYDKLTGPATAAHFHGPAAAGVNAPPVVPVAPDKLSTPIKGEAKLTAAQAADLLAGKWYFNVHTAANPGGEIRGQMEKGR